MEQLGVLVGHINPTLQPLNYNFDLPANNIWLLLQVVVCDDDHVTVALLDGVLIHIEGQKDQLHI